MANNRTTRTAANTFDPNAYAPLPLPGSNPAPVSYPSYDPAPIPFDTTVSLMDPRPGFVSANPQPTGGAQHLPTQSGAPTGPNFGIYDRMGWVRQPNGRFTMVPRAQPRRDVTGSVLRTIGGAAGGLLGSGLAPGVGGIGGNVAGRAGGSWLARLLNRMHARRGSNQPDTLTRDQIRGRQTSAREGDQPLQAQPVNGANYAQTSGANLARGMEGTYLDRTVGTTAPGTTYYGPGGAFNAYQRGNQLWNDTRTGPTNLAQRDEITRPTRFVGRGYNPGYSTTREAMEMANGPVTAFRRPQEQTVNNPDGLPWIGDASTGNQGPVQFPAPVGSPPFTSRRPLSPSLVARLDEARQRFRRSQPAGGI